MKRLFLVIILLGGGLAIWYQYRSQPLVPKPNPVPLATIKALAERYKPTVVFDQSPLFYPVRFDGLKKVALECDKQVIAELEIDDRLRALSNQVEQPADLFDTLPADCLVYYYSLSTIPERWPEERVRQSFPDTLSLYVNASFDKRLKITYTIPFEGNQWRNFHRGDGAMFALYFDKKDRNYEPIKARAYMHLQYSEVDYQVNALPTDQYEAQPIFFVVSGSHSTYHRPGVYPDADGLPFLKVAETAENEYAYCQDRIQLVFLDSTRNKLEKWAFDGMVYWGGSPNDRIHSRESTLGSIPLIRSLPLGNKSAKMIFDPSAVFDRKRYERGERWKQEVMVKCQ